MSPIDQRAVPFRRRMVATLIEMGVTDEAVLEAMEEVPRHHYVGRFWTASPGSARTSRRARAFVVDDNADDETLELVYRADTALATRGFGDRAGTTSSLSAPIVVASMLAELELVPGLRVLEIGTGSGYHAALMARLVSDPGLLTTVDIDETLIAEATSRLDSPGCGAMTVRCADGALGVPDRAPFDRIVATVGCTDISPVWTEQLAVAGRILAPLQHGYLHPRVLVQAGHALDGRFVGHSGFVPIQGVQSASRLWRAPEPRFRLRAAEALPAGLKRALASPHTAHPHPTPGIWDLAVYLAVRDGRTAVGPAIAEHDSIAMLHDGQLVTAGGHGAALGHRLLEVCADWLALGAPGLNCYTMSFSPHPAAGGASTTARDGVIGPWEIDRLDHRQTVALRPP